MQKYTASVITAGCLWGLMGLFTRTLATYGVDSTGAIVLRCGIAALLFAVTLLVRDSKQFRIRLKEIWCFIGTGICSLLFFTYCYFQAITIMDLSTAAVLLYTAPSIVMILSLILFHERITVQKLIALVLAFAGCCLVSLVGGEHKHSSVGILYGLGAGIGIAMSGIIAGSRQHLCPLRARPRLFEQHHQLLFLPADHHRRGHHLGCGAAARRHVRFVEGLRPVHGARHRHVLPALSALYLRPHGARDRQGVHPCVV